MTINRKVTGTAVSIPKGISLGMIGAFGCTLIETFIAASLIEKEIIPWESVGYSILIILLTSSWTGAMISSHKIQRLKYMICALSGIIYFSMLVIFSLLFFGGQYSGVGETFLLIICGSILAMITNSIPRNRGSNNKIRIYRRSF